MTTAISRAKPIVKQTRPQEFKLGRRLRDLEEILPSSAIITRLDGKKVIAMRPDTLKSWLNERARRLIADDRFEDGITDGRAFSGLPPLKMLLPESARQIDLEGEDFIAIAPDVFDDWYVDLMISAMADDVSRREKYPATTHTACSQELGLAK